MRRADGIDRAFVHGLHARLLTSEVETISETAVKAILRVATSYSAATDDETITSVEILKEFDEDAVALVYCLTHVLFQQSAAQGRTELGSWVRGDEGLA